MRNAMPIIVAMVLLGMTQCAPVRGEWILEVRDTFLADRRAQPHPCCPKVDVVLEESETPAVVCVYYSNNFKKKDKGRVRVRSEVHGLESGTLLGDWQTAGWVRDREWIECVQLGMALEPCLVEFDFSLVGFPRMKKKPRRTDGFMVGAFALPDAQAAGSRGLPQYRLVQP